MSRLRLAAVLIGLVIASPVAMAQGTEVAFGGLQHDSSLPIEISADSLAVDQSDGSAVFEGNVTVGQGEMRLSAGKIRVEYANGQ